MNGYIAFYNAVRHEIRADTLIDARDIALAHFRVPKSKRGLLAVELAELGQKQVTTTITS